MKLEGEMEDRTEEMSNLSLHTRLKDACERLKKLELDYGLIIYRTGFIAMLIRFLIRIAHSGVL